MIDGAKLDTARDCKFQYKLKRESITQVNTDPDKRDTKNANEPLSTLALETVLRERPLEIFRPRCVCMRLGEPSLV